MLFLDEPTLKIILCQKAEVTLVVVNVKVALVDMKIGQVEVETQL